MAEDRGRLDAARLCFDELVAAHLPTVCICACKPSVNIRTLHARGQTGWTPLLLPELDCMSDMQ